MAFGLGVLRLPSAAFWTMTPREMAAAMRPMLLDEPDAIAKARLDELMRRYPDK